MSNLGDVLRQVTCIPSAIPDDWSFRKLTDVCSPKQWRTVSSSEMTESGYPVFGANGFVGFYPEYNHTDETIAITCRGNTCGTINRIPPKTYITGNSMALDNVQSEVISQNYLYYALKYRGVGDSISGSAQPQITGAGLRTVEFPAPPLPEQKEIAAILTSVDEVIEKTRAQIDKLKDLKAGMMQELLTKGIGHTEFKGSPMGRIPASWEVADLISLSLNGISNGVFNDPKKVGKGKKIINVYDMYQGFGVNTASLKLVDINEKEFSRNQVKYGDVFFTRSSLKLEGIAYCNINLSKDNDITYDGHLMRVRPDKNRVHPKYLAHFCLSDHARKFFMAAAKHSTMTTIGQADISSLEIALPPLSEQEEIISVISAVECRIKTVNTRLQQKTALKKALMQDLLTGKVRVQVDTRELAEA
ncbi:restriction endonuclease subunit S [Halomonas colorata]|uniref:restriction endonuclease subunit S n=1 Tax=Halomonas colorata TaxID=2742615 RepID=UPI001868C018|nr:restriction endonuclease subunit S [Halomonas colorata]